MGGGAGVRVESTRRLATTTVDHRARATLECPDSAWAWPSQAVLRYSRSGLVALDFLSSARCRARLSGQQGGGAQRFAGLEE
jgi:hypothetical protein